MSNKRVWVLAREKAEEVLDMFKIPGENINLDDVCEYYDISVEFAPLIDNVSGYIEKKEANKPPVIVVNSLDSSVRQRFTLAHELGHFFERDYAEDYKYVFIEYRGCGYDLHEFYADEFAGALLMPENEIRKMREKEKNVINIAKHFNVSLNAVRKRFERLDSTDKILKNGK